MTEVQAEQALAELESKVKLYNSTAQKLQLIPQTANYVNATSFEAAINPHARAEEALVRTSIPCMFMLLHTTVTRTLRVFAGKHRFQKRQDRGEEDS